MFKVGRWRNEKIKVVFRLQFQATQVLCSKSRLMISLVPVDVGQPTVRLEKAAVQDGICTWENPVYEAVKFIRETKTGKLQDKFYHFIISTGSSKAGCLGEVSVNLADYVEATTPFTISLPTKSSNSGAILHVTIQNMQGEDDQRELQRENEENRELENSLQSQISNSQLFGDVNQNTHENEYYNTTVSPNDKGRRNLENENTLNSILQQVDNRVHQENQLPSNLDWSSEDEVATWLESTEKNVPREREQEQEPPKSLVEQLEREIFALKRHAEVTDIEVQSLRRQVVKETKRGQDLSKQVVRLREERDAFRAKFEKLRSLQKTNNGDIEVQKEIGSESQKSKDHINEVEEELTHAKDVNRALRSQLRKAQDSNSEFVLVARDLEEKLDKKNKELANLHSQMEELKNEDCEHQLLNDSNEVNLLQQQIQELQDELEGHVKEKRKLEKQIEQFSQDYEISKEEYDDLSSKFNQKQLELIKKEKECAKNSRKVEDLESQIARLERVIKNQAKEFSESSDMINELETEVNSLKYEMERQAEEFEEELKAMSNDKVLQEENLRKMKLENANTAQRLKEEFQKLSEELALKFKENEELTKKANEDLQKANEELGLVQDQCEREVQNLSLQLREKEKELEEKIVVQKNESEELRSNKKKAEDKCEALSHENQALRMEVERLTEENYYFTNQLEEMKTLVDETNTAFEEESKERDDLERKYASAKMEIEQSEEELKTLRLLKEKEDAMNGVQLELESLRAQHDELEKQLSELKSENENLRKQVTKQKESLQKKDQEIALLEKFKNSNSKEVSALKEKVKQLKAVRPIGISPESGSKVEERKYMGRKLQNSGPSGRSLHNGANRASGESRRETFLEKKIPDSRTSDLQAEVSSLKEKNKSMEDDLREMQEKYSEVSLKFAEVEGERQQLVMTVRNLRNGQKK